MYIKVKINIDKRNEETILHNGLMSWQRFEEASPLPHPKSKSVESGLLIHTEFLFARNSQITRIFLHGFLLLDKSVGICEIYENYTQGDFIHTDFTDYTDLMSNINLGNQGNLHELFAGSFYSRGFHRLHGFIKLRRTKKILVCHKRERNYQF